MLKKFAVMSVGALLFTNLVCSVPKTFKPESFKDLDVNNPESLSDVAHILNLQDTLLKDVGLFNPTVDKQIEGHSGHYVVSEISNSEDKKKSLKDVLGSDDNAESKTVYTYGYNGYQAKEKYPVVTGSFDGVKDTASGKLHLNGSVQIKLENGSRDLRFYLGDSSNPPSSVVLDASNKDTAGKISLSISGESTQKEYNLSSLDNTAKDMIKKLGFLNIG